MMINMVFIPNKNSKLSQQTISFGAADTVQTLTLTSTPANPGRITRVFLVIPNWTNNVTTTVAITDADSNTLYSVASLARNTTHDKVDLDVIVHDECTVTLTLSGVPGGTGGDMLFSAYTSDNVTTGSSVLGTVDIEVGGVAPQLDDTDKIAVSVYGKSVAAGDVELLLDAAGNPQVDIVSTTSDAILTTIDADTSSLAGCVGGTELQVDIVSTTSDAILTTIDADTSSLAGCVGGTELQVDIVSTTSDAILTTIDADTSALAGCVGGTELQVDIVSTTSDAILTTIDADTSILSACANASSEILTAGAPADQISIGSGALTTSTGHTGSAIDVTAYNQLLCILVITSCVCPDAEDSWEVYLEKSYDGGTTWVHAAHFVEDQTAGDVTTTTGDVNRGRFDNGQTGSFQVYLDGFMGTHVRSRAVAHDQNSDADMELTFSVVAVGKK